MQQQIQVHINNNSASNTIRGVYHNARASDGGAQI